MLKIELPKSKENPAKLKSYKWGVKNGKTNIIRWPKKRTKQKI